MNASCWLAEAYIIIKDVTDNILQMANLSKCEKELRP
jgi:hypothetical protein